MPRSRPGPWTGTPLTSTCPLSGRSRPAIIRNSVDFPQPDGPSKTRNSPMSRPSWEKASSTSNLTFFSASTRLPSRHGKLRQTSWIAILILFGMHLHWSAGGHRGNRFRRRARGLAPWKQTGLYKRQQKAEQERGNANRNDSRINALEVQHLARGFDHVSHPFARVHHFRQNDVGP